MKVSALCYGEELAGAQPVKMDGRLNIITLTASSKKLSMRTTSALLQARLHSRGLKVDFIAPMLCEY